MRLYEVWDLRFGQSVVIKLVSHEHFNMFPAAKITGVYKVRA